MDSEKRIVEIHGIKMEVDLRYAKRIDTYRVGDAVKLLIKEHSYSSSYSTYPGVIVGFCGFAHQPAIEILYLKNDGDICLMAFSEKADAELAPFNDYEIVFTRADVLEKMDRKIFEKEEELHTLKLKREAFVKHFGEAFPREMEVALEKEKP
ncbi:MAG: hypothetical protein AMJ75_00470 [Phycisphaerae bacterium SM1_79]|nr:MAG: hypothetical protein AMJ75_00470 [Phycisphaerae bacterium SM1_79]